MFQRVKETISDYAATAQTSRKQRITRRRVKPSFMAQRQHHHRQHQEDDTSSNKLEHDNNNDEDNDDADEDEDNDDNRSVQSTITVETTRTANNENRKLTANPNQAPTQVFVEPSDDPYLEASEVLERAQSDITKLSIYLKQIEWTRKTASAFIGLVRGENRSWEAIAVDILRQKARWESITMEDCEGEYMDTILGFLMNGVDQCAFLHLSNLLLTPNGAWTFRSLQFEKHMIKLQLDLIDLSFAIPMLCQGLKQNSSLECLIASRCGLNDDRLQELFTSLPKQLAELRIFGNRCREKGLAAITAVVHHSQHLKILDLSYQHVQNNNKSDGEFDISWLAGALHHNRTLKVLDLDNDGIDDGHLTHLCAAFCANETLEEVMLNHNRITAMGIGLLSQKFGEMKGLKKISMYSNLFDAPQVDAMVVVSQNKTPLPRQIHQKQTTTTTSATTTTSGRAADEEDEEEVTSDLEDEEGDDDDEEDFDYEEEIIGEVDDDDDDDDGEEEEMEVTSYEGDFMDDDSSAPPPSADFREPEEMENDSIADETATTDVGESLTPATAARKNVTDFLPEYWSSPKQPIVEEDNSAARESSVPTSLGEPEVHENSNNVSLWDRAALSTDPIPESFAERIPLHEAKTGLEEMNNGLLDHKPEESFSEAALEIGNDDEERSMPHDDDAGAEADPPPEPPFSKPVADEGGPNDGSLLSDQMFAVADPKMEASPPPIPSGGARRCRRPGRERAQAVDLFRQPPGRSLLRRLPRTHLRPVAQPRPDP